MFILGLLYSWDDGRYLDALVLVLDADGLLSYEYVTMKVVKLHFKDYEV